MSSSRPQLPAAEPTYDPSRPFPKIQPLYKKSIMNCPGKTLVALHLTFPPNGSTPPHTHPGAFVCVHVVSGYTLNKMNYDPMQIFGPGETFTENPGCKHKISDNASATEPATMIATFVVDTKVVEKVGIEGLVVIDEDYKSIVAEAKQKSS
ncbi:cupin domain protein [Hyaloscypha hepaticicola]|uniref:Cupin domain protein n=1 Tax=Hyaloscypha hepaticicola TaxID=2082293 RepID=A0A2J6PWG8_9HELO|nr:cupin domain protein [Hyaloscypha hepaticicola]